MAFVATRRLVGFGKNFYVSTFRKLRAVMHEGFLGSNHKVDILLDKKFVADMLKNIKWSKREKTAVVGMDPYAYNTDFLGEKEMSDHKITIIIE